VVVHRLLHLDGQRQRELRGVQSLGTHGSVEEVEEVLRLLGGQFDLHVDYAQGSGGMMVGGFFWASI
jgi:hypothetical protein